MRRRTLLALAGGALTGLAGCGRDAAPGATPATDPSGATGTPTTDPPANSLSVSIRTDRYYVQTFPARRTGVDRDAVVPAEEVAPPLREALVRALDDDGTFRTDDPSTALLAGIDAFRILGRCYRFRPFVDIDGTVYEFDPSMPEFVATFVPDAEDADPERTADYDEIDPESPVFDLVDTIAATTTHSCRDDYRISVVPEAVESFVAKYDYLRTGRTTGRIETERIDPGAPYAIRVRELTDADWWGRPVVEAAEQSAPLRRFLREAVGSDRRKRTAAVRHSEYRTDSVPDDYRAALGGDGAGDDGDGQAPYVRVNGEVYDVRVSEPDRGRAPAVVEAATEPPGPDGRERFSVTVTAVDRPSVDDRFRVSSRGGLPSLLWLTTDEGTRLLDSPVNETIEWQEVDGARRVDNVVTADLHPEGLADTSSFVSATYTVPKGVPPGTHVLWGFVGVSWRSSDPDRRREGEPYPFQVDLDLTE